MKNSFSERVERTGLKGEFSPYWLLSLNKAVLIPSENNSRTDFYHRNVLRIYPIAISQNKSVIWKWLCTLYSISEVGERYRDLYFLFQESVSLNIYIREAQNNYYITLYLSRLALSRAAMSCNLINYFLVQWKSLFYT